MLDSDVLQPCLMSDLILFACPCLSWVVFACISLSVHGRLSYSPQNQKDRLGRKIDVLEEIRNMKKLKQGEKAGTGITRVYARASFDNLPQMAPADENPTQRLPEKQGSLARLEKHRIGHRSLQSDWLAPTYAASASAISDDPNFIIVCLVLRREDAT